MNKFSVEELFDLYKDIYNEAREGGDDDEQAGKKAWHEICEYEPAIKSGGLHEKDSRRTNLLSHIGGFRYRMKIREGGITHHKQVPDSIDKCVTMDRFDDDDVYWTERMESAAIHIGRIIDPKFVVTFIGPKKASQFSAYVGRLRNEGYKFVRDEYGWLITDYPPEPEPEPAPKQSPKIDKTLVESITAEVIRQLQL
jgi:hypothetical protein